MGQRHDREIGFDANQFHLAGNILSRHVSNHRMDTMAAPTTLLLRRPGKKAPE